MVTLKEVAERAGVSPATASRVLSRDPALNVMPETRRRVIAAAAELNYTRTPTVKGAGKGAGKRTEPKQLKKGYRIGIAQMFDAEKLREDIYYMALKNALEEECFQRQWATVTLLRNSAGQFVKNDLLPLDGLIAIGRFTQTEIDNFRTFTENLVFLDSTPDPLLYYSVVPNYHFAVQQVLSYFRECGFQRVAYVGSVYTYGHHKELTRDPRFYYYRAHMVNRDCFDEELVLDCPMTPRGGYEVMTAYLKAHDGKAPEAMFLASDAIASGLMRALREWSIRVPEDASIIAFNNTSLCEAAVPPLHAIELFMPNAVRAAAECMDMVWHGDRMGRKIVIPCKLVERESVTR